MKTLPQMGDAVTREAIVGDMPAFTRLDHCRVIEVEPETKMVKLESLCDGSTRFAHYSDLKS